MKKSTFVGMMAAGVTVGVATYAIVESGVVEKTEDFLYENGKKVVSKAKNVFKKKKAEVAENEELVEVETAE